MAAFIRADFLGRLYPAFASLLASFGKSRSTASGTPREHQLFTCCCVNPYLRAISAVVPRDMMIVLNMKCSLRQFVVCSNTLHKKSSLK